MNWTQRKDYMNLQFIASLKKHSFLTWTSIDSEVGKGAIWWDWTLNLWDLMLSPGRQGKTLIWYSENLRTAGFGKPHHEHTFCGPLCCECGLRVERSHRSDLLRTRTFENQSGDLVNRNSRKEIRQKKNGRKSSKKYLRKMFNNWKTGTSRPRVPTEHPWKQIKIYLYQGTASWSLGIKMASDFTKSNSRS